MNRLPDWERRLDLWLARSARAAAASDEVHCGFFAADAVEAITGTDLVAEYRDAKTVAEGRDRLKANGFADHIVFADAHLAKKPVGQMRAGDVGATEDGALVVIQSRQAGLGVRPGGTVVVPAPAIVRVWEV